MLDAAAYFLEQTLQPGAAPNRIRRRFLLQTARRLRQARPLLQTPLACGAQVCARDTPFATNHYRFQQHFAPGNSLSTKTNDVVGETSVRMAETIHLLPSGIRHFCNAEFRGRAHFSTDFNLHEFVNYAQRR